MYKKNLFVFQDIVVMCQNLEEVMLQKLVGMPPEEIVISGPGSAKKVVKPKAVSAPATSTVTPVTSVTSVTPVTPANPDNPDNHVSADTPPLSIDESVNSHSSMQLPPQPIKVIFSRALPCNYTYDYNETYSYNL